MPEARLAAAVDDIGGDALARFLVDVADHHLRALIGIGMRDGAADAAGGAGDDRHLALECLACRHEDAPVREGAL